MSLHDVQIFTGGRQSPRRLKIALILMAGAVLAVVVLLDFTVASLFSIPVLALLRRNEAIH